MQPYRARVFHMMLSVNNPRANLKPGGVCVCAQGTFTRNCPYAGQVRWSRETNTVMTEPFHKNRKEEAYKRQNNVFGFPQCHQKVLTLIQTCSHHKTILPWLGIKVVCIAHISRNTTDLPNAKSRYPILMNILNQYTVQLTHETGNMAISHFFSITY